MMMCATQQMTTPCSDFLMAKGFSYYLFPSYGVNVHILFFTIHVLDSRKYKQHQPQLFHRELHGASTYA